MLRPVPCHDIGQECLSVLAEREPERLKTILRAGRRHLGRLPLSVMEARSRRWAARQANPHYDVIDRMAAGAPVGLWFMNFCYEWGCTTAAFTPPGAAAPMMRRTLDWPFPEIGRNVILVRADTASGPVKHATWPGFLGIVGGLAPGRFAIMINQAPLPRLTGLLAADWLAARWRTGRRTALPPAHLLRLVFEQARTFDEAVRLLSETPTALPVIYTVAGTAASDVATIERGFTTTRIDRTRALAANHWRLIDQPARARGSDSPLRASRLEESTANPDSGFLWLEPPILNRETRLALEGDMATGTLRVVGYEESGPATEITEF